MKQIKIFCMHPSCTDIERLRIELRYDEREHDLEFVWDEEQPDYIIITEMVYYKREWNERFLKLFRNRPIVIFFPREFIVPDMNFCDYGIAWDRHFSLDDRIIKMPTMFYYSNPIIPRKNNLIFEKTKNSNVINQKDFCSFIYSNGGAHPFRDTFFQYLSKYKKVASWGKHLNNMGNLPDRNDKGWMASSIELKSRYKFSITCNNHLYAGGIDEKLLTTFAAHSVPIFWGDPTVGEEFNEKAMVNCHKYKTYDEICDAVMKIDRNDELWYDMICQPWQTEEQLKNQEVKIKDYTEFITHIFEQDKEEARRAGEGSARDAYMKWFEKRFEREKRFLLF